MNQTKTPSPLLRLWQYATSFQGRIRLATFYSVLNKIFDLAPPVLIGGAVDIVVRRENSFLSEYGIIDVQAQLLTLAGLTFAIWLLESLFEYLYGVMWRNLAQAIQHELRIDGYRHIQGLEMSYFEDRSTGGLMAILNDDINQLERFLDVGANDLLQIVTTVLLIGTGFFILAPEVAWMSFAPIPIILYGSFKYQRKLEPRYADVREQVGVLNSQLANNLGGMSTIKSFTMEDQEVERVRKESQTYQEVNQKAITLSSAFSPLIRIAVLSGFTPMLVFGGFLALDGQLEVGVYSVMVFMTQRLLWPLTRLGQTFDLYQRAMASTNRVLNLLDTKPKIIDGNQKLPLEVVKGQIEFDDVTFAYQDGFPVLKSMNLEMAAGKTTAIVGPTGSGKSTVIKLLLRLYDINQGSIKMDGHELRDLKLFDLRQGIGLVSQDVFLFHGTVRENIAYGDPNASDEAIVEAAKIAESHEFILQLPQGYDTVVGERGQKLSGGQRQRISIARAVLKNPPILILDEATSAVDNETEAAIQRSLERISLNRTTIVIAHRLSTIRHAHQIYVLHQGELVEQGDHDQLVDQDGLYAGLWKVQTGKAVQHQN